MPNSVIPCPDTESANSSLPVCPGPHQQYASAVMNRPGFDGDSGDWISTRGWSVRFGP